MPFTRGTSPETRRILLTLLRGMTPERRLQVALAETEVAREFIRADLRERFPAANAEELHEHFLERWLGPDVAAPVIAYRRAQKASADTAG